MIEIRKIKYFKPIFAFTLIILLYLYLKSLKDEHCCMFNKFDNQLSIKLVFQIRFILLGYFFDSRTVNLFRFLNEFFRAVLWAGSTDSLKRSDSLEWFIYGADIANWKQLVQRCSAITVMEVPGPDSDWRSPAFRQKVVAQMWAYNIFLCYNLILAHSGSLSVS